MVLHPAKPMPTPATAVATLLYQVLHRHNGGSGHPTEFTISITVGNGPILGVPRGRRATIKHLAPVLQHDVRGNFGFMSRSSKAYHDKA